GLMIGIDVSGKVSAAASAGDIQLECLKMGLCISTAGAQTLRFLPPLVVTMEEIDAGLDILYGVLSN
ncbi:MAG: aminotransferase class III-fold pyridoxal phosphate-dependent enzyme, partial [Treponema sp.]